MKMITWIDAAFEKLLAISAVQSSISSHKAIRDLRIARAYESAQKLKERVARVLEDIQKSDHEGDDANPMLRAPENVLKSAACMLVVSEIFATRCIQEMARLERGAESWKWLSVRHRRVTLASYVMPSQTVDQLFLTCDQKQAEAVNARACLAAVLGRLRRSVYALETSPDVQQLHVALKRHLLVTQGILGSSSLKALMDTVKSGGFPRTPSRAAVMGLTRKSTEETIAEATEVIQGMTPCVQLLSSASQVVGMPPMLLRRWPELLLLSISTIVALITVRPITMFSAAKSVAGSMLNVFRSIIQEHLEEPAREIYKELFVKHDDVGLWATQAQSSRESLARMIQTFNTHATSSFFNFSAPTTPGPPGKGLDVVVRVYEEQMSRPVTNILFGDMLQALLIQMQSLKANMEEEAAEVHALMKANQISLQAMAAVPAIAFVSCSVYFIRRLGFWVMSEPAHPRNQLALLFRATERLLAESHSKPLPGLDPGSSTMWISADSGFEEEDDGAAKIDEQWGHLCFVVEKMRRVVNFIYISQESRLELLRDLDLLLSLRPSTESKIGLLDSLRRGLPYMK